MKNGRAGRLDKHSKKKNALTRARTNKTCHYQNNLFSKTVASAYRKLAASIHGFRYTFTLHAYTEMKSVLYKAR